MTVLCAGETPAPEITVRSEEVFIPYEEFLKVSEKHPDALVMTLEEYRALVGLAASKTGMHTSQIDEAALPSMKCTLSEAAYAGRAHEHAARFEVAFKLAVAGKEWARCDLGAPLPGLGRVTLDGKPGWVVIENGHAWLLVKGGGAHTGTLSFTLPIQNEEDVQRIASPLLAGATAVMRLEVEERATQAGAGEANKNAAANDAYPLDVNFDEGRNVTVFTLGLGTSQRFGLSWKRKHDAQKNQALLLAEEKISYLLNSIDGATPAPSFHWTARVSISRRKAEELSFREPPGGRTIRLTGANVHSWHREGEILHVLFENAFMGDLVIEGDGLISAAGAAPGGQFELGCMSLKDAAEDTGYVALFQQRESQIEIDAGKTAGFMELALNEVPMPQPPAGQLARLFLRQKPDAKLGLKVFSQAPVFDTQAVVSVQIDEKFVTLRSVIAVQVEQGRVYTLSFNVPSPWTLAGLRERTQRGLGAELERAPAGTAAAKDAPEVWTLTLSDAADAQHSFEFETLFRHRDPAWGETELENRPLNFVAPFIGGIPPLPRRSKTFVGLSVHPSIDISFGDMPGWQTESVETLARLGVPETVLRAGLMTELSNGEIRMILTRKKPRVEYEAVTHVLTSEREVWVRSEIRLAVLDRSVEELLVTLPENVKEPLFVNTTDLKEVAPGDTPTQRRVRFNRAWEGTRMLRIEYRAPLAADTEIAVPDVRIEGNYDSRRRIVFQSAGVVELKVAASAALLPASLEDTQDFAHPFKNGRALFAFTFANSATTKNPYGTFSTHLYERSPVLADVARQLDLITVIDASGVSRTHAAFLILYSREQYIAVRVPEDATLVALSVDDQNVRPVQGFASASVGPPKGGPGKLIAIPLPPNSSARVELVYECSRSRLGNFGTWEEAGLDLLSVPVGVTNWTLFYPRGYDFSVASSGGNVAAENGGESHFFADSFWASIRAGELPHWTAWEPVVNAPPGKLELPGHAARGKQAGPNQQDSQQLVAQETQKDSESVKAGAIGRLAIPEGAMLKVGKLGGSARVELSYRDRSFSRFAARSVFIAAILIALALSQFASKRALVQYVVCGLVIGTLLPVALNWQSPLLAVPFCEGLSLVAVLLLLAGLWRGLVRLLSGRTQVFGAKRAAVLVLSAGILAPACAHQSRAGESGPVYIPYVKDNAANPDVKPEQMKAFVPKEVFQELMRRAHPETQEAITDLPNLDDRRNVGLASAGAIVEGGNSAALLTDGNLPTQTPQAKATADGFAWTVWKSQPAQSFIVTLKQPEWIDTVRVLLQSQRDRYSQYRLEISLDGKTYKTVADRSSGKYRGWQTERFARTQIKFVRLTGTFDSGDDGCFRVGELQVLTAPTIIPVALGNAQYELKPDGEGYVCTGTLEVSCFDPKGWVKLPLDFGPSQLVGVSVDGQPASIAHERGIPFVQLKGEGVHLLNLELRGPLTLSPGRAQLRAKLVGGAATRLIVLLPKGVELEQKGLPAGAWLEKGEKPEQGDGGQRYEIDLGPSGGGNGGEFGLSWQSADIRAKGASQIASRSYTQYQLGPDGYGILRVERINIDGSSLDQFTYKVIGNWEISSVTAGDLAEWTVSGEGAEKRLRLWFQKPVNAALIQIFGWATLEGTEDVQAASLAMENAVRQEGFIGLQHGSGRRFNARSLEVLKRSSSAELLEMFKLSAENLPDRIYHFHEPAANVLLGAEVESGQAAIETHAVGVVKPGRLTIAVRSRYTATGRTPVRHEVLLPAGYSVRTVRCNAMRTWEILESAGQRRLVVYFTARAITGTEIIWSAERTLEPVPATGTLELELPQLRVIGEAKTTEILDWVLAADQSLDLFQGPGTTMHSLPLDRAQAWVKLESGEEYHSAFRSAKPDSKLVMEVSLRGSIISAARVSFIRPYEDHVLVNVRCRVRIQHAGRERFDFKFPTGVQLVSVSARNLRSREINESPDGLRLGVLLQSAVTGEQIIDLAYRIPRAQGQDVTVEPVSIEGAGIKQSESFVGVVQPERGMVLVDPRKGLTLLRDFEQLPFLPENVSTAALTQAFSAESDWSLVLRQPGVKVETGQSAEVILAVLKTVIADDGNIRNVARYSVRNRALQFLLIEMPADAKLWGVLIDGQPVTVSQSNQGGQNILRIPIQRMGLTDLPMDIELVYESAPVALPSAYITITPLAPKIKDIPVVETYWELFVPEDYEVTRSGGNMKDVVGSVLIGGRLKSDVNEVERLMKFADDPENPNYQRRKALRGVARKQQELNDFSTELRNMGQSANSEERRRINREDLEGQMSLNGIVEQQAGAVQMKLKERSKDLEDAVAGGEDPEQKQAFFDNYGFLNNSWRSGSRYKNQVETPRPMTGDVALAELRNLQAFEGFKKGALPAPPLARRTQYKPLPLDNGLREDGDGPLNMEKGAADLHVAERGAKLTFRRVEGHPELTVTLRSRNSTWRYASIFGLLIFGAGFWWVRRR